MQIFYLTSLQSIRPTCLWICFQFVKFYSITAKQNIDFFNIKFNALMKRSSTTAPQRVLTLLTLSRNRSVNCCRTTGFG